MKFKIYAAKYAKVDRIKEALEKAKAYFPPLTVEFSDITVLKERENNRSLYVLDWARTFQTFSVVRSIKPSFLQSLPIDGYDGLILFMDKKMARETNSLYGQHTRIGKASYIQVFINSKYVKLVNNGTEYKELYQGIPTATLGDGTSHGLKHEIYHALSWQIGVPDLLHEFIAEGQFDTYKIFLQAHIKPMNINSQHLFNTALSCLNTDVTPKDNVPDNVACAEVVNAIYAKAFGAQIGGGASTHNMYLVLLKHPDFTIEPVAKQGDIIISPTGFSHLGAKTPVSNGHVGIVGENGQIMSNSSSTGLFQANYTLKSWTDRYVVKGGYPLAFFRRK